MLTRREFIGTTLVAGAALSTSAHHARPQPTNKRVLDLLDCQVFSTWILCQVCQVCAPGTWRVRIAFFAITDDIPLQKSPTPCSPFRLQADHFGDLDIESRRLLDGASSPVSCSRLSPEDAGKRPWAGQ
jgi:hypothetical protein